MEARGITGFMTLMLFFSIQMLSDNLLKNSQYSSGFLRKRMGVKRNGLVLT